MSSLIWWPWFGIGADGVLPVVPPTTGGQAGGMPVKEISTWPSLEEELLDEEEILILLTLSL